MDKAVQYVAQEMAAELANSAIKIAELKKVIDDLQEKNAKLNLQVDSLRKAKGSDENAGRNFKHK